MNADTSYGVMFKRLKVKHEFKHQADLWKESFTFEENVALVRDAIKDCVECQAFNFALEKVEESLHRSETPVAASFDYLIKFIEGNYSSFRRWLDADQAFKSNVFRLAELLEKIPKG